MAFSRRIPWMVWVLGTALGIHGTGAAAQSLVDLVNQARGYDAAWQSSRAALDAAMHRGEQARAGLLPSVGLQAGASYTDTELTGQQGRTLFTLGAHQQSAGINASQPLYRPANLIGYQQGQRSVDLATAQLDAATQDLLVRTSQAYFDVLVAEFALTTVQAQKQAVAEQLAFAQRNFDIGNATITDAREAQARHDLVQAQEIAARNDLHVKQLALAQITGRVGARPLPLIQPVVMPPLTPADVAPWVEQAENEQPLVRQARIALDIAQMETRKAEAGHKPTVDLQASYGVQRNPDGSTTLPNVHFRSNAASVGVVMNLPLFAGFAVQNRVKETVALEEKARADLDNAQRSAAQATRTAFFNVQSGMGQIRALEAAVASSQSALDANQVGYKVGVRINIDVLNAQSQLYQTQRDLAQARYNVLMGQLRLRQAAGTLTLQDLQAVNAMIQAAP